MGMWGVTEWDEFSLPPTPKQRGSETSIFELGPACFRVLAKALCGLPRLAATFAAPA